jgi:hypothetical protein
MRTTVFLCTLVATSVAYSIAHDRSALRVFYRPVSRNQMFRPEILERNANLVGAVKSVYGGGQQKVLRDLWREGRKC